MDTFPLNGLPTPPLEDVATPSLSKSLQKLYADNEAMRASIQSFQIYKETATRDNFINGFDQSSALISLHSDESELFFGQQQQECFNLMQQQNMLITSLGKILEDYINIQNQVIMALKIWQRKQALAGNGAPFPANLDEIQSFVEALMDRINEIIFFCNCLLYLFVEPSVQGILNHAQDLHNVLIFSTFIVEKQPSQVIKTGTKFSASVRWLIGRKLDIHQNKPKMKCEILSEAQAKRLAAQNGANIQIPPTSTGVMIGNECSMVYDSSSGNFSANFAELVIKSIQRSERKGPESVMDEKCTLLFYTTTQYKEYEITCWTLTVPLVVVVHNSQAPQSMATTTWDNAFYIIGREPFQVPDKVHYTKLLEALNMKFASLTGGELTPENLDFLSEKLLFNETGQANEYITYSRFCRDRLPGRNFTFWEWFYAIMKLVTTHLNQMWTDGLIVGFINKQKTLEEILPSQPNGTFLLRFSDSECGAITIAVHHDHGRYLITPWTANDLVVRSLADRVNDLPMCQILYPKMLQRDAAFGSFYTPRIARDGYVPAQIVVQPPQFH
ncbi:PREDICTED: signal transducer and transcription activator-like [Rhagoletis zephyria]|uniref:signal transducer and transcription activator-like n=1 Tax=Rhagoletis zephyria TaxID=28612 RepID=UPI0008114954|nr:PREDICTED: signal transducer and transcription activator-like [Rhagoletis zephyria]XP_017480975.1 PREDICTED: signal transducer and transcription activator-like [Rhagoletis zephyria]